MTRVQIEKARDLNEELSKSTTLSKEPSFIEKTWNDFRHNLRNGRSSFSLVSPQMPNKASE